MTDSLPRSIRGTKLITKREYLVVKAILTGVTYLVATEAVATTALEHPEWDMSEEKTFDQWEDADASVTT